MPSPRNSLILHGCRAKSSHEAHHFLWRFRQFPVKLPASCR
ncbi:hypothetical protein LI99_05230 [Mycolicibacterium smegmatis]|uniref:Uncharacterized protein n=1 Tax=Mycolicibacterium smegmatis (strain ATCC 700084 / mc(2)155) TaxID=246196 RepID=A0QRB2_MYCS2|nr:hypothetical protein MSMEG_2334 [Mycolicibacterium smegmatis MC2 155]AIU12929.1 hypothetical protein LI99_05230 [Mycolicibacterium smegmatis]ABK74833.1 hypothetical protein MSMEG_1054 [Mycolicibacterium smegmatis MC2 155]AIU06304.1 hypothetical protein LJ00_05230 [Mycolicibacterium smegmatis MC2 155]AIU19553.1 hypothetical protein LI98_05230 [Mycolicibacterium smegmatis]